MTAPCAFFYALYERTHLAFIGVCRFVYLFYVTVICHDWFVWSGRI